MTISRRAALLLALAFVLVLPAGVRAEGLALTASASTVNAGDTVSFAGSGFIPGERVTTWATAPDQDVVSGDHDNANNEGRVTLSFRVPSNAVGGRWAFTAFGRIGREPVSTTFQVVGRDASNAPLLIAVEPYASFPGGTFAFAARGFKSGEKISWWATDPKGDVYAARPESQKVTNDGRVDFKLTTERDAPRGVYVMTIQGYTSGTARAIRFEIR